MTRRLLVTGASGRVGSLIRPLLTGPDREIRLLDVRPPADGLLPGETFLAASITDPEAMESACAGVDLLVHLGGHSHERAWAEILQTNIHGTYVVLEAARRAGVRRVLLAGSAHAVGMVPAAQAGGDAVLPPRPDTFYGVSKATAEALGSLYADAYGMSVVSARIGTVEAVPGGVRSLSTWFSPGDAARLVEACLARDEPGHHIVWGVSRNRRRWVSPAAGEAIGFVPVDDAEHFAAAVEGAGPPAPPDPGVRLGGPWSEPGRERGQRW
ncbi:putative NADH-flavin reductase [Streptosporangium becharense]|uniref:Putative NADH-flavin reductase n=1 Tax=Streptosporangium becharense TaxID=1816182 RepID=A0A7W9IIY7_9ACTN|nr:NAD(P)-dependent oxidoreductase [Streptosporangium becharense]MBB2911344.1 putative NADH-flavin reductase [Streptosporangium becharense]MBB5821598.1 putative NADH-flavin reductase [Streptosporangium becharense]